MKHFYSFFCISILLSFNLYSQSDLLGTWYLDYIIKDGVTHNNYYNEGSIISLAFTDDEDIIPNYYQLNGNGTCNYYFNSYTVNNNTLTILGLESSAVNCLGIPKAIYETLYFEVFSNNNLSDGLDYTWDIAGEENDQILTLINTNNGDTLVYKKIAPTTILVTTWYLSTLEIPGNPNISVPLDESPTLTLTNNLDIIPFSVYASGSGDCNGYNCGYSVSFNGANNININNFSFTLIDCSFSNYENDFFSILGISTSNFFEFEITNNGSTLILTDLLGAKLIFGDTTLSIDEQSIEALNITLVQNPIDGELKLKVDDFILTKDIAYKIYSINGTIINSSTLNSDTIDVNTLPSGLYFISFSEENKLVSTLKFIKK
ncbi:T9SS type A sorting domain-containing protein [Winogradskyella sp. UBA3174]|uniref:T9SS type A sorting domain-containing protein n=1 Tax=Winogradskyella sp. UBA3174 TaxID=1947785 RepID=UPI0025EA4331|nr:T9SS type A sorting domain-containing protein [Winogradskyella sp. UBA3174]|tara:strand:+ start:3134 stop:4258 length:1125 start_codon:yes stop_codon:yes gene_type:complete